ncbi:MAG: transketolase C-terminal domain-containing protein, partial [Sphaerochaeta sp.]
RLASEGKAVRVISMPSPEVFEMQDDHYRNLILPREVTKRVVVEAAWTDYWYKYVGLEGKIIGMHSFGESAPAEKLYEHFNIRAEAVYQAAASLL